MQFAANKKFLNQDMWCLVCGSFLFFLVAVSLKNTNVKALSLLGMGICIGWFGSRCLLSRNNFENSDSQTRISTDKQEQIRLRGQNLVLEMLNQKLPVKSILETLAGLIEQQIQGICCSILLVDPACNRLTHGAAPNIPKDFIAMVDGLKISPRNGSCGTAAFRKEIIIVDNIEESSLWGGKFQEKALQSGFRSCWSTPILNAEGNILGTFAIYCQEPRKPENSELSLLQTAGQWAALAIERKKTQDALTAYHKNLEQEVKIRTQALQVAREKAEKANQAKFEFLSSMSHELRTPLNAILGFTQLLKMEEKISDDQVLEQQTNHIMKAGENLLELINNILNLSEIESGKVKVFPESVRLETVFTEISSMLKPIAKQKNISLEFKLNDPSIFVWADLMKLKQVLTNLISNAIKYNNFSGKVNLKAYSSKNDTVAIEVSDTGQGIPENQRSKIFEPFIRLKTSGAKTDGTGIGLAITRHLIQLMGGCIFLKSKVEEGSTFKIILPKSKELPV